MATKRYALSTVQRLRRRAQAVCPEHAWPPEGWSISAVDPGLVLDAFPPLRLREGLVLRAYQYFVGGNGNARVWALPVDAPFPAPAQSPQVGEVFRTPPRPAGALDDVMDAIVGDGSPWSYVCASIFAREIGEFGAFWHGCDWSSHELLGNDPIPVAPPTDDDGDGNEDGPRIWPPKAWCWSHPRPADWRPSVRTSKDLVTVTFHTYTGLAPERIDRHRDTYRPGSYRFESETVSLAYGPGGYVY
jgi:hypothetical protein